MKASVLKNNTRTSPLESTQLLKNGNQIKKASWHESGLVLPLTSLIDAFSIIVIYLLIGTQSGGLEVGVPTKISLPVAESGTTIESAESIIRIIKGQYFINEDTAPVDASNLGEKLVELKNLATDKEKEFEILIQADQQMDFAQLDPVIRAGSEAGIQTLKFAVMPKQ
ncbi:MAG: ExbD/TolR family protein [Pseudobdellovibrionaceae bacterium]